MIIIRILHQGFTTLWIKLQRGKRWFETILGRKRLYVLILFKCLLSVWSFYCSCLTPAWSRILKVKYFWCIWSHIGLSPRELPQQLMRKSRPGSHQVLRTCTVPNMAYRLYSQDWSCQYLWDLMCVEATDISNGRCVFWMNCLLCVIRGLCCWKKSVESVHWSVVSCVFKIVLRFDNLLVCGQVKSPQEANLWKCERKTELISRANTKRSVYDSVYIFRVVHPRSHLISAVS